LLQIISQLLDFFLDLLDEDKRECGRVGIVIQLQSISQDLQFVIDEVPFLHQGP
jgi:hypothetical protein